LLNSGIILFILRIIIDIFMKIVSRNVRLIFGFSGAFALKSVQTDAQRETHVIRRWTNRTSNAGQPYCCYLYVSRARL